MFQYLSFLNISLKDFTQWKSFYQLIVSILLFPQYFLVEFANEKSFTQLIVAMFIFSRYFLNTFWSVENVRVAPHCLYRDSSTLTICSSIFCFLHFFLRLYLVIKLNLKTWRSLIISCVINFFCSPSRLASVTFSVSIRL